ncbi:MAG: DMT family transporter [Minisyncoccota bacterium]
MLWLVAAIIPPVLWSVVNHMDKYLLSKSRHQSSVNVLMVYSTLFSAVIIPIFFFFSYSEIFANPHQIITQIVGGILLTFSIYFYLLALNNDETSVVIPFALLVPVFGFFFGYILLGEVLTAKQIFSSLLIVFGALILSLEFNEENRFRIKHKVLWFMVMCTAFQAAQETLFKFVTIDNSYVVSIFWLHVGILIYGIALLLMNRGLFLQFKESLLINGKVMLGVNAISETISAVAYMVRNYATLLAPIAIIMALNGYQPAFVFVLGVLLTIFFPKIVSEKIKAIHLIHKSTAIAIMIVGTVLISQTL